MIIALLDGPIGAGDAKTRLIREEAMPIVWTLENELWIGLLDRQVSTC